MTTKTSELPHAEWCNAARIETTDYPEAGIRTTRCVDCGSHLAQDQEGKPLPSLAFSGALVSEGRGDMDISMERAPKAGGPR